MSDDFANWYVMGRSGPLGRDMTRDAALALADASGATAMRTWHPGVDEPRCWVCTWEPESGRYLVVVPVEAAMARSSAAYPPDYATRTRTTEVPVCASPTACARREHARFGVRR